jgi:sterol desaturase/sphingolipid hydroxylase (fatty acid hydroxylase superfamily)
MITSLITQALFGLVVAVVIFVPLERLFALRREQRVLREGWRTDVTHFLVTGRLVDVGLIVAIIVPAVLLHVLVAPITAPLVTSQPWLLQFSEALLIASIGGYVGHRLTHEVPLLWKFHRVHHSIEKMDWLAAPRLHPIDSIFTRAVAVLPLVALGFTKATFGAYLVFLTLQAIFVHSNVRLKFGPLRWVFGTPEWHHWHHAADAAAYNKNFSAELPWLDVLFGTAYMPKGVRPTAFGLQATEAPVPLGWWAHMKHPFAHTDAPAARPAGESALTPASPVPHR